MHTYVCIRGARVTQWERAKQTGIARTLRAGEARGGEINTLSGTIAAHVSRATRPLRHKFRGFNKDSWLPLAERSCHVVAPSLLVEKTTESGRRLLRDPSAP